MECGQKGEKVFTTWGGKSDVIWVLEQRVGQRRKSKVPSLTILKIVCQVLMKMNLQ